VADPEQRLWNVLLVFAALLPAFVPAYFAYDLYARGPTPEKYLELSKFSAIDPLKDLSILGDRVTLSLQVAGQAINNLVIVKGFLRNAGRTPIVPSDYHERLSVNVERPWKIVAVENGDIIGVPFRWTRVSDTRFEADPALLNPGDLVSANVYLTNTRFEAQSTPDKQPEAQVEWRVRITNLRGFSIAPSLLERLQARSFGATVRLSGWSLIFTIVSAALFQAVYLHLLSRARFLRQWTWRAIVLVVGASLLSFAAAESSATYIFGAPLAPFESVDHWINSPWIALHVVVLVLLYLRARSIHP
jgi:hypothetical protein